METNNPGNFRKTEKHVRRGVVTALVGATIFTTGCQLENKPTETTTNILVSTSAVQEDTTAQDVATVESTTLSINSLTNEEVVTRKVTIAENKTTGTAVVPTVKPTTRPTTEKQTTVVSNEFEGVAPERLEFTKKLLNAYNHCGENNFSDEMKGFINKDQIINFGKTGEGLTVVNHENGTPAIALINCKSNIVSSTLLQLNINNRVQML